MLKPARTNIRPTNSGAQLRTLFAIVLIYNSPQDPRRLWEEFKDDLVEDKKNKAQRAADRGEHAMVADKVLYNEGLWDIELMLNNHDKSLRHFACMADLFQNIPWPRKKYAIARVKGQTILLLCKEGPLGKWQGSGVTEMACDTCLLSCVVTWAVAKLLPVVSAFVRLVVPCEM